MRVPRLWNDTDEAYHRRRNRILRATMHENSIPDLDAYVLARMFDYTGHLVRSCQRKPDSLLGKVIRYRCCEYKQFLTEVSGHQGHSGRIAPWDWERQFHSYFSRHKLAW
eukprot:4356982-Karenia_brevis.AAC.1